MGDLRIINKNDVILYYFFTVFAKKVSVLKAKANVNFCTQVLPFMIIDQIHAYLRDDVIALMMT